MSINITIDLTNMDLTENPDEEGTWAVGPILEAKIVREVASRLLANYGKGLTSDVSNVVVDAILEEVRGRLDIFFGAAGEMKLAGLKMNEETATS